MCDDMISKDIVMSTHHYAHFNDNTAFRMVTTERHDFNTYSDHWIVKRKTKYSWKTRSECSHEMDIDLRTKGRFMRANKKTATVL